MPSRLVSLGMFLLCTALLTAQQPLLTSNPTAQITVPHLIRFTGTLPEKSGATGITFSLYKTQQGGAPLWTETQNITTDASGKYSALVGVTKADGIPQDLFTTGEAQWLSIRVEGQPEQPRILLVSVPYALKAAEAETLAGHTATEFVTADKLNNAVAEQVQQSRFNTTSNKHTSALNGVINTTATTFTDSNSSNVVTIYQNGSGQALVANAKNGSAITGNSNATTGATIGILGQSSSTSGIGLRGFVSSTTGSTVGLFGSAASISGIAIAATESATSGFTTGLQATVSSANGIAAIIQNKASGKLISGRAGASNTEVFSVDGSGKVNTNSGYSLDAQPFAFGSFSDANAFFGFSGNSTNAAAGLTSLGYFALKNVSSGGYNTAIGYATLNGTTVGLQNTAVGAEALELNSSGSGNTAVGYAALIDSTGYYNAALGLNALSGTTAGAENSAFGSYTLFSNTIGSANSALGYGADVAANNLTNATAIGALAYVGQSNTIVLGSINGKNSSTVDTKVGIGTITPTSAFQVLAPGTTPSGYAYAVDGIAGECSASGCTGVDGVSSGANGSGLYASATGYEGNAIFAQASGSATSAGLFYGDVTVTFGCLKVNATNLGGTCSSDQRLKTNIHPITINLDKLAKLRPVHFNWRPDNPPAYRQFDLNQVATGLIAQQVEALFPEMVSVDKNGYRQIDYGQIPFMLLAGVGELKSRNDRLSSQLRKQEDQIRADHAELKAQQVQMLAQQDQIASLLSQVRSIQATLKSSTPETHVANAQAPR